MSCVWKGKRESAYFEKLDENERAVGMLNPLRDKNEGGMSIRGARSEDTCDHGLSKTPVLHRPQKKCHFAGFFAHIYEWKHLYLSIFLVQHFATLPQLQLHF